MLRSPRTRVPGREPTRTADVPHAAATCDVTPPPPCYRSPVGSRSAGGVRGGSHRIEWWCARAAHRTASVPCAGGSRWAGGPGCRAGARSDAISVACPVPRSDLQRPHADLADSLDLDTERIFRFVADEIRYEPYVGILRGPTGTLATRAGNAADQASLLAALLQAAAVPVHFAWGALDEATATTLLAGSAATVDEAQQHAIDALLGPQPTTSPTSSPEPGDPRATPAGGVDPRRHPIVARRSTRRDDRDPHGRLERSRRPVAIHVQRHLRARADPAHLGPGRGRCRLEGPRSEHAGPGLG